MFKKLLFLLAYVIIGECKTVKKNSKRPQKKKKLSIRQRLTKPLRLSLPNFFVLGFGLLGLGALITILNDLYGYVILACWIVLILVKAWPYIEKVIEAL